MPWVTSSHHVLGVKHLLGKFWYCECTVLLGSSAGERSKSRHEEVKTRERNHVHCQLPEISIQLRNIIGVKLALKPTLLQFLSLSEANNLR